MTGGDLIGRSAERARLTAALASARSGRGSLLLLAGEAGAGKTRLAEAVLADGDAAFLRGAATPACPPFGPLTQALRRHLRTEPDALDDCGPLRSQLAVLLPELGDATPSDDRATLFEAIRCALASIANRRPAVLLLDDLHWSDDITLELIAALAPGLQDLPLLVVGAHRSDELPRVHPLRRLRDDLRRERVLDEIELGPLSREETAELAERTLGTAPSPRLTATLHDRTGGVPFFVEELAAALRASNRLDGGGDIDLDSDVPLPRTVRDAVLVQTAHLSEAARKAAEAAAVAGTEFDLELMANLGGEAGISELLAAGVLRETEPGQAAFRHPLVREALYDDIPWLQRRTLHRRIAESLEQGDPAEVAGHWIAARDAPRALEALMEAIAGRAAVHAHRDAARLGRQALDLWPPGERPGDRLEALDRYAHHAELAGDLSEAARAQREVITARHAEGTSRALADAERRIAALYALQGDREHALAARRVAAEAYAANDLPGEAAAERLVMAGYHQSAGRHHEAVATARAASDEAIRAERTDLRARALGLEGVATVKLGTYDEGIAVIRSGLSLALEHGLTVEAAEVFQRLGTANEIAGDYAGAREALGTAMSFCERGGAQEQVCLSCMAYVMRELGDWDQAETLCADLIVPGASAGDTLVADGILGAVHAWRGRPDAARPLLERCLATSRQTDVVSMECDSTAALAGLEAAAGNRARARELCDLLLDRWERSEDHHYAVWGLRWAAVWLARDGAAEQARACAEALSAITASAGHPDALAALAHALGEAALAEGDAALAAEQLERAVKLHDGLDIPFERAQILLRAGVAAAAAGERELGLERLSEAHRVARSLAATPLAAEVAAAVAELGEPVERHLGRRAAADHEHAGLSRRELEVLRLVAAGHTNREVADQLVVSVRTVDMHVRNILGKLSCRTRTEAAGRAADLGLV